MPLWEVASCIKSIFFDSKFQFDFIDYLKAGTKGCNLLYAIKIILRYFEEPFYSKLIHCLAL